MKKEETAIDQGEVTMMTSVGKMMLKDNITEKIVEIERQNVIKKVCTIKVLIGLLVSNVMKGDIMLIDV